MPILVRRGEFRENINPVSIEFGIRMILISGITTAAITKKNSHTIDSLPLDSKSAIPYMLGMTRTADSKYYLLQSSLNEHTNLAVV
jgi:hypothetical protein